VILENEQLADSNTYQSLVDRFH